MKIRFILAVALACFFSVGGLCVGRGVFPVFAAEDKVITIEAVSDDSVPRILQEREDISADRSYPASGDIGRFRLEERLSTGLKILSVDVEGVLNVVPEHVLSAVTSKVGEAMNEARLGKDADAIFELGFFANVDYKIVDEENGVRVVFMVEENPVVESIDFTGNSVFSSDTLRELCFTKPGMVFNRVFFRNDLQRIKERYQQDGYVMARVADVRIEGSIVNVIIVEPRIGEIIIQGNKRTKMHVIQRQVNIKEGDLFNATYLRHTLGRLQGLGYFGDVNVGFEPNEDPEKVNVILTVEEAKTGKVGISIGYGTQSGWGGGLNYNDSNWRGLGHNVGLGFELGDREQYWLTYEQPFMNQEVFAWRFGAYKRSWKDLTRYIDGEDTYHYDEVKKGIYAGLGRKFSERSKLSWFLTADWHDVQTDTLLRSGDVLYSDVVTNIGPNGEQIFIDDRNGRNFSLALTLQRNNLDPYLAYNKGDIQAIHIEKGFEGLGGDWDYWKYWTEVKWFLPLDFLSKYLERTIKVTDVPPLFAMRLRAGTSSGGYVPWGEQYVIGGDSTMRGLKDEYFRGNRMFLGNFELRIPVQKSFSIVAFYDTGKAWNTYMGQDFDLGDLESSYGFGVRVKTPMGNMRLDFAQGTDENRVHFGFGEMF